MRAGSTLYPLSRLTSPSHIHEGERERERERERKRVSERSSRGVPTGDACCSAGQRAVSRAAASAGPDGKQ
jgi:hypothetical protein